MISGGESAFGSQAFGGDGGDEDGDSAVVVVVVTTETVSVVDFRPAGKGESKGASGSKSSHRFDSAIQPGEPSCETT